MTQRRTLILVFLTLLLPAVQAAKVNDAAPAFELPSTSDTRTAFQPTAGKVTLINFWASWCAPCAVEFPKLDELAAAYAGKDVRVIAVSVDKELSNAAAFLKKRALPPIDLEIAHDADAKTAKAYAASAMPMSYIVDRKGVIRYVHTGYHDGDAKKWRDEIEALLHE